jgi:hypothetical protein
LTKRKSLSYTVTNKSHHEKETPSSRSKTWFDVLTSPTWSSKMNTRDGESPRSLVHAHAEQSAELLNFADFYTYILTPTRGGAQRCG